MTSGLDESTDWEIMRLLRRLADDGMTIIMVTHTLANVTEFCDKVVCMGRGGQPTFVGAPSQVLDFFAVTGWARCSTARMSSAPSTGAPGSRQPLAHRRISDRR